VAIAKVIARNETSEFTAMQYSALKYAALCQMHQTTKSASLDVAYQAFSLGGSMNNNERSALCSKSFEQNGIDYANLNYSSTIFDASLGTIDKCIGAAERGWKITYDQVHKDAVSLSVANLATGGSQLLGIDMLPAGSMSCDGSPTRFPIVVTSTNALAMTCTRVVTSTVVDGVAVNSAPDVTLNLRLAEGPFPIRMKGYNSSVLEQIKQNIAKISSDVAALSRTIANLKITMSSAGELSSSTFWTSVTPTRPNIDCPDGSVLSGFGFDAHSDGLIRGVGTIRFRCSSLTK
jgi:hypothetical protein